MYEDFHVTDRWSGEDLHCRWKANMVAIATRHADAVDVRFDVNGRPMWIALPCTAWVEQKKRTGKVITDQLAAQIAGRYLKQLIEEGYDSRREVYTMTVADVLDHLDAVVAEAKDARRNACAAGGALTDRPARSRVNEPRRTHERTWNRFIMHHAAIAFSPSLSLPLSLPRPPRGASANPVRANPPLPNAIELLQRALANERKLAAERERYECRVTDEPSRPTATATRKKTQR